jgi:uncharacterized protein YbjQ (UPF0145 family)
MATPKDVLVITTSSADGLIVKQYLKPISAHIVAGTNFFSDFFASFNDVFGGRSQTYQKQLVSLYSEAIERIKFAAYELGANGVVGLNIDMDEISGKGKSMLMLTAIGTAVVFEKESIKKTILPKQDEKFENVGVDRINTLRRKKAIVEKAGLGDLNLNDEIWSFITSNQVGELFPYLLKKFEEYLPYAQLPSENSANPANFYKLLLGYIDAFPEDQKIELLYNSIKNEKNEKIVSKLAEIIKDLNLFDFKNVIEVLNSENFKTQKIGLKIATYDKPFYNKQDKIDLQNIIAFIKATFIERGKRTTKKQLLSSKEKEVWTCECGKTNDIDDTYCNSCKQNIYGFKENEMKPETVNNYLEQKLELISEYVE